MVLGLPELLEEEAELIWTLVGADTCTCLSTGFSISFDTDDVEDEETLTVVPGDLWTGTILGAVLCGVAEEVPVVR